MKSIAQCLSLAFGALLALPAVGGTIHYVAIPATASDAHSGISLDNSYTSAVHGGNANNGDATVNGVMLHALSGEGNTVNGDGISLSVASGTIAANTKPASALADGDLKGTLSGFTTNAGADDNSEQYAVLDPAGLKPGTTYDLRIYVGSASGQNRLVNLTFAGDGKPPVSTDFFNEDDATTSPGGFTDTNQAYYIDYQFTWDGATTPGITVTQKSGAAPFAWYAVTNQQAKEAAVASKSSKPAPGVTDNSAAEAPLGDDSGPAGSDTFYTADSLNKSGRWVQAGNYGLCWQPTNVGDDWRPYTNGHWQYSSQGWAWNSDQPWGWATYHYGRWTRVVDVGWVWVPGRVWAPSWCSWRTNDDYCGWAPLPPDANCNVNVGISSWVDSACGIGPDAYNFCGTQNLGAANVQGFIVDHGQNADLVTQTSNCTNISNNNVHIFSGGPNVNNVNSAITRAGGQTVANVPIRELVSATAPQQQVVGSQQTVAGSKSLAGVKALQAVTPANIPKNAAVLANPKFDNGWKNITDPKIAELAKQQMKLQAKGSDASSRAMATGIGVIHKPGDHVDTKGANALLGNSKALDLSSKGNPNESKALTSFKKPGTPLDKSLVKTDMLKNGNGLDDKKFKKGSNNGDNAINQKLNNGSQTLSSSNKNSNTPTPHIVHPPGGIVHNEDVIKKPTTKSNVLDDTKKYKQDVKKGNNSSSSGGPLQALSKNGLLSNVTGKNNSNSNSGKSNSSSGDGGHGHSGTGTAGKPPPSSSNGKSSNSKDNKKNNN